MCRQQICLHAPMLSRAFQLFALSFEGGIFIAFGFGRLTRDPSVLRYHRLKIKPLLSSAMVFNQIGQPRQRVSLHGAFSELDALSGSKTEQQADRASYGSVTVAHHPVPKPTQLKPLCEQGFHISRSRKSTRSSCFNGRFPRFLAEDMLSTGVDSRPDGGMDSL